MKPSSLYHNSDNIYFNISLKSQEGKVATYPDYNATRTRNIIDRASDYYMAVVRFTIPSFFVPLWVFEPLDSTGLTPNEGVYQVTLQYGNEAPISEPLIYTFQGNPILKPSEPAYYWVFDYQLMVDMFNTAIASAYSQVITKPVGSAAPFMTFDPTTKLFAIYTTEIGFDFTAPGTNISIFINDYLYTFLNGFPHKRLNMGPGFSSDNKDVQILAGNYRDNLVGVATSSTTTEYYYITKQQYVTLYNWNPYKKIVLQTSLLPVQSEYIAGDGDKFSKILTDFQPNNDITDVRSTWQYIPTGQYRLIDLLSSTAIRRIDCRVFWEDVNGRLYPIGIPHNGEINIKLGFFRKSIYKNTDLLNPEEYEYRSKNVHYHK